MEERAFGGAAAGAERPLLRSIRRGFRGRCPHCGDGRLFRAYLKVTDRCDQCGEEYHHHRADDLPAYLVIFIVGHVVVGAFMIVETMVGLATWQHLVLWVPLILIAVLVLLQPVKGAVVGLQWANHMHGFGDGTEMLDSHPEL